MKTDYPELEGEIVDYIYQDGTILKGKLIGCSYHLGITIVDINNENKFLLCLNKKIHSRLSHYVNYRTIFYDLVKAIKLGAITYELRRSHRTDDGISGILNTNCAFM